MDTGSMNTTSVPSTGGDRSNIEGSKEWHNEKPLSGIFLL
jgi:hypothetical protein